MSDNNKVYITTTLPYVNADPHIGHAMEFIRADVLARYLSLKGKEVFLNTGTDEHGAKIDEAAKEEGIDPQAYTDRLAKRFQELGPKLGLATAVSGITFNFIRTTDTHHKAAAQEFWKKCAANGDIYKKLYKTKYCIGCELEKTDSELVGGHCVDHPNRELEIREEENYFFKFSRYQEALKKYFADNPTFVIPETRRNEMRAFLDRGLEDFSISRVKAKMPWGVAVPDDETQVMYVWFDALVNYISAIGWPTDMRKFESWWPVIQYCGKDNTRQQSLMWQAMLMSAKIPLSSHIIVNGFITSAGGVKMSKSLGNVINPFNVIEYFAPHTPFPEDVLRFVLLHDIPSFEDGGLTFESIQSSYAAHLQNGIGNLTSRIMKMATTHLMSPIEIPPVLENTSIDVQFEQFDLKRALESVMRAVSELDVYIQETAPFKVVKTEPEKGAELIVEMIERLHSIAFLLRPFLPRTAEEILRLIREHKMPEAPLFNRLPQ